MEIRNFSIQELLDYGKDGGRIICFGAGQALDTFLKSFSKYDIEKYISAVLDNNAEIWGVKRKLGERKISIQAPDIYLRSIKENVLIVVTCQYLNEIKYQLETYENLSGRILFYGFLLDRYCDYLLDAGYMDAPSNLNTEIQIPKVIHYCWFGKNPIPQYYKSWMASWKNFCPDYEIVEWNESNYNVNENIYMSQAYEMGKWGFVPDYARLDIIYKYGGIYLDTDVEVIRPLDSLLGERAFAGFQDSHNVALGLGFGAAKGNAVIKSMRDDYNNMKFIDDEGRPNLRSSPSYQTESLKRHGLVLNGMYQKLNDITIFPKVYFSPMNHYNRQIRKNEETYTVHHFDGSWVGVREKSEQVRYREVYLKMK